MHYPDAWLALSQAASGCGPSFDLKLVKLHRGELRQAAYRKHRDVGSYIDEMDILCAMLNEFAVAVRIKFKSSPDNPLVTVLP